VQRIDRGRLHGQKEGRADRKLVLVVIDNGVSRFMYGTRCDRRIFGAFEDVMCLGAGRNKRRKTVLED
jgi:hypothetical protein